MRLQFEISRIITVFFLGEFPDWSFIYLTWVVVDIRVMLLGQADEVGNVVVDEVVEVCWTSWER